jgi:hypothetical protein
MIVTLQLDTSDPGDREILRHVLDRESPAPPDEWARRAQASFVRAATQVDQPPEPRPAIPDAAISSEAVVRGRDALRALVGRYREPSEDLGENLGRALNTSGMEIAAYVDSCGGSLPVAVAAVWGDPGVGLSPDAFEAQELEAHKCAGSIVTIASAMGFQVPESWWRVRG